MFTLCVVVLCAFPNETFPHSLSRFYQLWLLLSHVALAPYKYLGMLMPSHSQLHGKFKIKYRKLNWLFNLPLFGLSALVTGNVSLPLLARCPSLPLVFSSARMLSIENDPWNGLGVVDLWEACTAFERALTVSYEVGSIKIFLRGSWRLISLIVLRGTICSVIKLWLNSSLSSFLLGFLLRLLLKVPSARR